MDERESILNAIISKGGLLSRIAEMYRNDEALTNQFILECYNQCHIPEISKFWGVDLVSKMESYLKSLPLIKVNIER